MIETVADVASGEIGNVLPPMFDIQLPWVTISSLQSAWKSL